MCIGDFNGHVVRYIDGFATDLGGFYVSHKDLTGKRAGVLSKEKNSCIKQQNNIQNRKE